MMPSGHAKLIVVDNLPRAESRAYIDWPKIQGSFAFELIDIRDKDEADRLVDFYTPNAIFNLAAKVAMTTSISNPRLDFKGNAIGTFNILEAVRTRAPEVIVIYSSKNKVYGDLEKYTYDINRRRYTCLEYTMGFDESLPITFYSPYGSRRALQINICRTMHISTGSKQSYFIIHQYSEDIDIQQ
jgi:CDP-paratose 2-epimerase